jgi:RNA polymerase sigma-70 factor (ECF subfamily)
MGKSVNSPEGGEQARITADVVARRSYGKLVAFLAVRTRDVTAAEDALSEAFTAALTDWPRKGCPANPEGWLLTVARRKAIDQARVNRRDDVFSEQIEPVDQILILAPANEAIPDERLAMMFACAHPAIDVGTRAPLILQAVLGLDAKVIASSFLTSPAAMGKRLVRAKEKIRQAGIPFRVPGLDELQTRLGCVLDAIYAAFTEGWSDPGGTDLVRRDLTGEALFLARLVAEMLPREPETLGLLALMLHAEARRPARRNEKGEFVPLAKQNPVLWDNVQIAEAEGLLHRAAAMGSMGRFQLEAALQSAHADRCRTGKANWAQVVDLYDALLKVTGSPVVEINRALALAELRGAKEALAGMPKLEAYPRLAEYQPYWATRADLLTRTGVHAEARQAYQIAIGLERDDAVRCFLEQRQSALPD